MYLSSSHVIQLSVRKPKLIAKKLSCRAETQWTSEQADATSDVAETHVDTKCCRIEVLVGIKGSRQTKFH